MNDDRAEVEDGAHRAREQHPRLMQGVRFDASTGRPAVGRVVVRMLGGITTQ